MVMIIKKDESTSFLIDRCFKYKRVFFRFLEENGYVIVDDDKLQIIEHKLKRNEQPVLNEIEAKMFATLVHETNRSLLETGLRFEKREYDFFKASDKFIEQYNKWEKAKKIA